MKAVVLENLNQKLVVKEVTNPEIESHEALVKVNAARTVCRHTLSYHIRFRWMWCG
jgi:D-arabinose 1-dehydrogenase-like Zn-dependent alcohol dehydrogenase